jgi:hypothetical protein
LKCQIDDLFRELNAEKAADSPATEQPVHHAQAEAKRDEGNKRRPRASEDTPEPKTKPDVNKVFDLTNGGRLAPANKISFHISMDRTAKKKPEPHSRNPGLPEKRPDPAAADAAAAAEALQEEIKEATKSKWNDDTDEQQSSNGDLDEQIKGTQKELKHRMESLSREKDGQEGEVERQEHFPEEGSSGRRRVGAPEAGPSKPEPDSSPAARPHGDGEELRSVDADPGGEAATADDESMQHKVKKRKKSKKKGSKRVRRRSTSSSDSGSDSGDHAESRDRFL